nr:MAG TPA: hypothetical protein [Caudoviricetes sp.]
MCKNCNCNVKSCNDCFCEIMQRDIQYSSLMSEYFNLRVENNDLKMRSKTAEEKLKRINEISK